MSSQKPTGLGTSLSTYEKNLDAIMQKHFYKEKGGWVKKNNVDAKLLEADYKKALELMEAAGRDFAKRRVLTGETKKFARGVASTFEPIQVRMMENIGELHKVLDEIRPASVSKTTRKPVTNATALADAINDIEKPYSIAKAIVNWQDKNKVKKAGLERLQESIRKDLERIKSFHKENRFEESGGKTSYDEMQAAVRRLDDNVNLYQKAVVELERGRREEIEKSAKKAFDQVREGIEKKDIKKSEEGLKKLRDLKNILDRSLSIINPIAIASINEKIKDNLVGFYSNVFKVGDEISKVSASLTDRISLAEKGVNSIRSRNVTVDFTYSKVNEPEREQARQERKFYSMAKGVKGKSELDKKDILDELLALDTKERYEGEKSKELGTIVGRLRDKGRQRTSGETDAQLTAIERKKSDILAGVGTTEKKAQELHEFLIVQEKLANSRVRVGRSALADVLREDINKLEKTFPELKKQTASKEMGWLGSLGSKGDKTKVGKAIEESDKKSPKNKGNQPH